MLSEFTATYSEKPHVCVGGGAWGDMIPISISILIITITVVQCNLNYNT